MDFDVARVWPEWETDGLLGSGPFGKVYLIRRNVDGRTVFAAAKEIRMPPSGEAVAEAEKRGISGETLRTYFSKFKNDLKWELTMYRTLRAQHLVSLDEFTVDDDPEGPGWIGYVRTGLFTPLAVYFDKARSGGEDAARLGAELCSALEACADYGMVHGEVKPENVLVTDDGAFMLADFGIRRCLEKAGSALFGGEAYDFDAPELTNGRKYTAASDIYALGMLMAYVANGCVMPVGRNPEMIAELDPGLGAVIRKATAYDPAERYIGAAEMGADIARLELGKKPARRAVATAAAFEAVKRNGGTVRPEAAPQERKNAKHGAGGLFAALGKKKQKAAPEEAAQAPAARDDAERDGGPSSAASGWRRLPKKVRIILLAALALIVIAAAVILIVTGKKNAAAALRLLPAGGPATLLRSLEGGIG